MANGGKLASSTNAIERFLTTRSLNFFQVGKAVGCVGVVWLIIATHVHADETSKRTQTTAVFSLYDRASTPKRETYDLGFVSAGQSKDAVVIVHNKREALLAFEKTKIGCACTTAKVPSVPIRPDGVGELTFTFKTSARPKRVEESFDVEIVTKDAEKSYFLHFRAKLSNFACFKATEVFHVVSGIDVLSQVDVPILESDTAFRKELRVETSSELSMVSTTLVENGDGLVARCTFKNLDVGLGAASGELRLYTPFKSEPDKILFSLRRENAVQILPSKVVFIPDPDSIGYYIANPLIKARSADRAEKLQAVKCSIGKSQIVNTDFKEVGNGLYRVKLVVNSDLRRIADEHPTQGLSWDILVGSSAVKLQTDVMFSN